MQKPMRLGPKSPLHCSGALVEFAVQRMGRFLFPPDSVLQQELVRTPSVTEPALGGCLNHHSQPLASLYTETLLPPISVCLASSWYTCTKSGVTPLWFFHSCNLAQNTPVLVCEVKISGLGLVNRATHLSMPSYSWSPRLIKVGLKPPAGPNPLSTPCHQNRQQGLPDPCINLSQNRECLGKRALPDTCLLCFSLLLTPRLHSLIDLLASWFGFLVTSLSIYSFSVLDSAWF